MIYNPRYACVLHYSILYLYLSKDGQEEIEVLVHGASNLQKSSNDNTIPRAFVSIKVILN